MSSITSTCLVEFDGKPLPSDVVPLLLSAYVDDSQQLPDTFVLRFRDPHRLVLAAAGIKIGSLARVSVQVADGPQPAPLIAGEVTAPEHLLAGVVLGVHQRRRGAPGQGRGEGHLGVGGVDDRHRQRAAQARGLTG